MLPEHQVEHAIADSLQEALRGHFDDALSLVSANFDNQDVATRIGLLRAQARVHVLRGYTNRALACLDEATVLIEDAGLSGKQRLRVQIHALFVRAVCCGQPHLTYEGLEEAAYTLRQLEGLEQYEREDVEMLTQVHRITIVRQLLFGAPVPDTLTMISLSSAVKQAVHLRRWTDLYALAVPYCSRAGADEVIAWLEGVLQLKDLPDLVRAQLSVELVDKMLRASRASDISSHLNSAEAAFNRCNHKFGAQDVQRRRLEHGIADSSNALQDLVSILVGYIEADYPFGVLHSATSPLKMAFDLANFPLYINLQQVFHEVCNTAGIRHERLLLELQLLATMNLSTGHFARVLELGRALWTESKDLQYWNIAYNTGKVLSLACNIAGRTADAEQYAREIISISEREALGLTSDGTCHLATILLSRQGQTSQTRPALCEEVFDMLQPADEDEDELVCRQFQIKAQMAEELCRTVLLQTQYWEDRMDEAMRNSRARAERLGAEAKLDANGNCDDVNITHLLWRGRRLPHHEHEEQAIRLCDALIAGYEAQNNSFRVAMKLMMRASCHLQKYQKTSLVAPLLESEQDYSRAAGLLEGINMLQQALVARHCQTRNHVELFDGLPGYGSTTVYMLLDRTETTIDDLRHELSALGTLEALLAKQRLANEPQLRDIYRWAIHVTKKEDRYSELWLWSQKRKGRSISDILGLGVLVPETTVESSRENNDAESLVLELKTARTALAGSAANERIYVRQRINDIESRLRHHKAFDEFFRLRNGSVTGVTQLSALTEHDKRLKKDRNVLFADWILENGSFYLLIFDCASPDTGQLFDLHMQEAGVMTWVQTHFATDEARKRCLLSDTLHASDRPLRQLDPLIAPLADVSSPGDLLVLSTTGPLASIPLHVLGVASDGRRQSLIERNPIVYTPSFSTLEVCLGRSVTRNATAPAVFAYAFDHATEAEAIRMQVETSAPKVHGEVLKSPLTKEAFVDGITQAPLVHFHGHCRYEADNVLGQSLVFASPEVEAETTTEIPSRLDMSASNSLEEAATELLLSSEDTSNRLLARNDVSSKQRLTVEDLFHYNLAANPAIVLIACESASQIISPGDEPLGLIAGLLCTGASSVLAASWKVPSGTGRAFSNAFYESLCWSGADVGFVDIAVALQQAVLAIRYAIDEEDEFPYGTTYHWGSFCLHGSWLYKT